MTLNPFKPFARYLKPHAGRISLGLSLMIGAQFASTAIPLALQQAVDAAKVGLDAARGRLDPVATWTGSTAGDLLFFAAGIVGLALLQMGLQMGMRWCLNSTSRLVENDIRQTYFGHLLTLSLSFFHKHRIGDLMARATNDLQAVRMFLGFGLRMLCEAILALTLSLAVMLVIDWRLTVWALLPMPVLSVIMRQVAGKVHQGFRQVQESFSNISARVQENLGGVRVVKAYVQREPEIDAFRALNRDYVDKNRRLIHIQSLFFPLTFLLGGISLAVILWLGGRRVISGALTLGQFVAFNAYLTRLIFPMINLGWMVDRYQRGLASMRRIDEILAEQPEIQNPPEAADAEIRGDIEFCQVGFAYDGQQVLRDIDLHVPAGSTLAIVGRVGSGKTTLARLIPRLMQTGSGQLRIDGVPVDQYPLQQLRAAIGYVPQETFLFSDSVAENIAFGVDEDVAADQVDEAVRLAQLDAELTAFPQGLDTLVGERGVTLSGGQKQRVALARAIIRQPRILILDDALASVDTYTEEEILKGLRRIMAQRTTILIAHRISTVRDADQIVVLDEGRLVEQGTHEQLVERNGLYADMHRRQSLSAQLSQI